MEGIGTTIITMIMTMPIGTASWLIRLGFNGTSHSSVMYPGLIHARTGAVLASFAIGCQRYHLRFYAARCRPAAEPRALRPMMKASTRATAP